MSVLSSAFLSFFSNSLFRSSIFFFPDFSQCWPPRPLTQELELLIATYQNVGNTPAKLAAMQRYIDRYPTTPKARQYQQVLLRQQ